MQDLYLSVSKTCLASYYRGLEDDMASAGRREQGPAGLLRRVSEVNRLERARAGRRPASGEKASAVVWEADSLMMGMDNPTAGRSISVHSAVGSSARKQPDRDLSVSSLYLRMSDELVNLLRSFRMSCTLAARSGFKKPVCIGYRLQVGEPQKD